MVKTQFDDQPTETHGEVTISELKVAWVDGVGTVEKGERIIPVKLPGAPAIHFAALSSILEDLRFAKAAFTEAEQHGKPNPNNIAVKALIFSGIIAYGRCFGGGVREARLRADDIANSNPEFSRELHQYLIDVRDKHVAHSVNAFDVYMPVAMVIASLDDNTRDGFGVGVTITKTIGITRRILLAAIIHLDGLIVEIDRRLSQERTVLHAEFAGQFADGNTFELAPIVQSMDRTTVGKRRA